MILLSTIRQGDAWWTWGVNLQYSACDEIIANVLGFIRDKKCDFRVTAKNIDFAILTLLCHYENNNHNVMSIFQ